MTTWIVTIIAIIGAIISIGTLIWSQSKYQETRKAVDQALDAKIGNLAAKLDEVKKVIGNGGYSGLRQDIQTIKEHCAGEMSSVRERQSSMQYQIDEMKK